MQRLPSTFYLLPASTARSLLRRYPALRQTWPIQQVHHLREREQYHRHPRRMASWFRDTPDLHTRACISNLEMPEAAERCHDVVLRLSLFDAGGGQIASHRHRLRRNRSHVFELAELLPLRLRDHVPSGQVRIDFEGAELGSSRAYLHWYNARCLTSSHEKFGLTIPAVAGYWTVPNVHHTVDYRTHLAVTNLDDRPYTSSLVLKAADGRTMEASVTLPPDGSRFLALDELFDEPDAFLGDEPGILYFGNADQPAMYYYFIANERLGTWRAQHL
jgi:hypothetical protein